MLNTNEKPREKFVEPDMASFSPKMVWLIDDDLAKESWHFFISQNSVADYTL